MATRRRAGRALVSAPVGAARAHEWPAHSLVRLRGREKKKGEGFASGNSSGRRHLELPIYMRMILVIKVHAVGRISNHIPVGWAGFDREVGGCG